ncbi:MAG: DUF1702 family protein [Cyclobacteriaceae bacterium]|nr:DUF1702 family protein [Cyclobacteriaceae bacterium]
MKKDTENLRSHLLALMKDVSLPINEFSNLQISEKLSTARSAFIFGYQTALKTSIEELSFSLDELPASRRGFSLEGASMAIVLIDELSKSDKPLLQELLKEKSHAEKKLYAIGVGWAVARLQKPVGWIPTSLDKKYSGAVADGLGFHHGFFNHFRVFRNGIPKNTSFNTNYDRGLGRALWFFFQGDFKGLYNAIQQFSIERHPQLWKGIGTACAFTGNSTFKTTLLEIGKKYEKDIIFGVNVGNNLLNSLVKLK